MPACVNCRLVVPFAICLVIICGCQKGNDAELAKAKAEAEAAKAELEKLKADAEQEKARQEAEPKDRRCVVSGELYATTNGGDVKRGAGVNVRLIPLTLAYQADLWRIHKQFEHVYHDKKKAVKNWIAENPDPGFGNIPRRDEWSRARDEIGAEFDPALEEVVGEINQALAVPGIGVRTDSEGRFSVRVEVGTYLLISGTFTTRANKIIWVKTVNATGSEMNLSLNQDSAVSSSVIGGDLMEPAIPEVMAKIVAQLPK